MQVKLMKVDAIRPYQCNPRLNDQAVEAVAAGASESWNTRSTWPFSSGSLHGRRLGEAVCMRRSNEPLIETNHLRELRQFTSVLTAVCRTYR